MIDIIYDPEKNALTVTGHAGAGKKGQDIVCAAVSALVLTLAENLQQLHRSGTVKRCYIDLRDGAAQLSCTPTKGLEAVVRCVFETVVCGLALVQKMHPEYVRYVKA